jgi:hypothetical protein
VVCVSKKGCRHPVFASKQMAVGWKRGVDTPFLRLHRWPLDGEKMDMDLVSL